MPCAPLLCPPNARLARASQAVRMGALTEEEAKAIEVVAHYIHDEEQAYCMLYGEGVFDTIPIEARPRTRLVHPRRPLPRHGALLALWPHAPAPALRCVRPCHRRPTTRWDPHPHPHPNPNLNPHPHQADYTVGDMKLWLKVHKDKDPAIATPTRFTLSVVENSISSASFL